MFIDMSFAFTTDLASEGHLGLSMAFFASVSASRRPCRLVRCKAAARHRPEQARALRCRGAKSVAQYQHRLTPPAWPAQGFSPTRVLDLPDGQPLHPPLAFWTRMQS